MGIRRVGLISIALSAGVGSMACEPPFPDPAPRPERGTLGEEIYGLFHADLTREAPERAAGFALERADFVATVDHLMPAGELADVQSFLVDILPLYDDGTMPSTTRLVAGMMARLEKDPEALRALAALLNREGYVSPRHADALLLRVAKYPRFRALATKVIDLALAHDGLDATGRADPSEDDCVGRLLASLADGLAELELSADAERTIVLAADLMTTEDPAMAGTPERSPLGPSSVVARDLRGLALLAPSAGMPAPFVDLAPADGLPDIDEAGRFVDANRRPILLPPFGTSGSRDVRQRALVATGGAPLYRFVEMDRTLLAGTTRDLRTLVDRGAHTKALDTVELFLGRRGADGRYTLDDDPLLDLAYAAAVSLDGRALPDVLELSSTLLRRHEGTLGWLLGELRRQLDLADASTAALEPGNSFFVDMTSWIRKLLREPNLAEDLLVALEDPAAMGLPEAAAKLMSHKKALISEADYDAGRVFTETVDRARADVAGNQSLQQRLMHLIYDAKGARYEPSFIGVPLGFVFEIADQGEFYMLSIIGEAEIPSLVARLTGLSTRPTPVELARFLNADQTFGNAVGNEGLEVRANDGDTLFAASASGMVDALRPLVRVFHQHGQLELLFELFRILHLHYASPASDYQKAQASAPRYSRLSGIARYEPLLVQSFREVKLLEGTQKLLVDTKGTTVRSGKTARETLLAVARHVMEKDPLLRTRLGAGEVTIDGERVTSLSPFDLARSALWNVDRALSRSNRARADWDAVVDVLDEVFAATTPSGAQQARFTNPRMVPFATAVLDFLAERARLQGTRGRLDGWLRRELMPDLEDLVTSDELPALVDLLHVVRDDAELSDMLAELRDQLLAEEEGFPELLALLGDKLEAARDAQLVVPVLRFLGRELHPDQRLPFHAVTLAKQALARDPKEKMLDLMQRSMEAAPDGALWIFGVTGAIRQANRKVPIDQGPLDVDDVRLISERVGGYLVDGEHGLEKFYDMVAKRGGTR